MTKHVLVTGGAGYVGSVLVGTLLARNCTVTVVDRFFFGTATLAGFSGNPALRLVKKDVRDLTVADFAGVDAVCDLAALSNDPCGNLDPDLTRAVNSQARAKVAAAAKQAGVGRYMLASSCSVYGDGESRVCDETSTVRPLTVYAECNVEAERATLPLADGNFCVTVLRNSTVFGLSPRMRFDLVVNLMTLHAVERSRIIITGGGHQWRPLIHVSDVARAFLAVLDADISVVNGETFNIGLTNAQILSVAYAVREALPFPLQIEMAPDDPDRRSYHVDLSKAKRVLGFEAVTGIADGVREIYDALKTGAVENTPRTVTVKWYRTILDAKRLLDEVMLNDRLI